MKWSWALNGSISSAALLLPLMAAAESHIQPGAPGAASVAAAHVDFKIVIPKVLYLQVRREDDAGRAPTVAIMSNGRNATLSAADRTPDSSLASRSNVILSTSGTKVIAQDAQCTLGPAPAAVPADSHVRARVSVKASQVVCTASMP